MLSPDDRTLYADCLAAPPGYRFDHGVATTFTLDLETLLVLPFTLATQSAAEPEALLGDPVALLESIRETADRLSVFHHDGYIAVPPKQHLLFGLLEDCVVPVRAAAKGGIFHPKLWLLRFVHEDDGHPLLRAVVLSRNLTFDRSWDTVLCLEGKPTGAPARVSYGLRDLVTALPELATMPMSAERAALVAELAAEAAHTRFDAPWPFHGQANFHAIGVSGRPFAPAIEGYGARILCVSPFVTAVAMKRASELATGLAADCLLVSRDDELDSLAEEALAGWDLRVLSDDVETGDASESSEGVSDDIQRRVPPHGLHAKLVVVEDTMRHVVWWLGSANLTTSAWRGTNVELMVELHTTKKDGGIDAFLDHGFARLLVPWQRSEPDPGEAAKKAALERAEALRDSIADARLQLIADGEEDRWDLRLIGAELASMEGGVRTWPVTLNENTHSVPLSEVTRWNALSAASLTSIVAFEVVVRHEGATATIRFALKLPAEGFPEDRHAHIVRQIVTTRQGFFQYLRFLLAAAQGDIGADALLGIDGGTAKTDASAGGLALDELVLEDLLRTLSRDPDRLDAVDRLVRDLGATEEGRALIPREFMELWTTVREVRPRRLV